MGSVHCDGPSYAGNSTFYILWKGAGSHPGFLLVQGKHFQVGQVLVTALSLENSKVNGWTFQQKK